MAARICDIDQADAILLSREVRDGVLGSIWCSSRWVLQRSRDFSEAVFANLLISVEAQPAVRACFAVMTSFRAPPMTLSRMVGDQPSGLRPRSQ